MYGKPKGIKRTVFFDREIDQKIRDLQANLISCNEKHVSYSKTMNYLLKKAFEKGANEEITLTYGDRFDSRFPRNW